MDQLEKLKEKQLAGKVTLVIPEYKCRKCGAVFELDHIMYPIHPSYYTQHHSECWLYSDCTEDCIGIADLQSFKIMNLEEE